jgi:hypothetical protein
MAFAVPWAAPEATDRRLNQRYPICIPLQYKLLRGSKVVKTGVGRALNLSSSGTLMESDDILPKGVRVELSLAWPATIDGKVGLSLVAVGKTVRATGQRIAVAFSQHSFRTRSLRGCVSSIVR